MITGGIKSRVARFWDTMWADGISNPLPVMGDDCENHYVG